MGNVPSDEFESPPQKWRLLELRTVEDILLALPTLVEDSVYSRCLRKVARSRQWEYLILRICAIIRLAILHVLAQI